MYLHSLIQAAYDSSLYTMILCEKEKLTLETSKNKVEDKRIPK